MNDDWGTNNFGKGQFSHNEWFMGVFTKEWKNDWMIECSWAIPNVSIEPIYYKLLLSKVL